MKLPPLAFLDLETTGGAPNFDRIIDIGIIKADINGRIIDKYESLINPGTAISPFISTLTGITDAHVEDAPPFFEIKDDILNFLKDTILVAHNARFDYGFLKGEYRRYEETFNSKHICSVKLARKLYPDLPRYNLDTLIETFKLKVPRRHRAYDDAKAVFDFYKIAQKQITEELFEKAINECLKRPSLPLGVELQVIDALPEKPGVYIFYGENGYPLYIGKSINIRDRVLSHFAGDLVSATEREIADQIRSVEHIETAGELGALLLESTLIKKYQPLFNQKLRYSRMMTILVKSVTKNGYSTAEIKEVNELSIADTENLLGTFRSIKQLKDTLYSLAKEYRLCPKILGLEKGRGKCFYVDIKLCDGACVERELNLKYNLRFEEAFSKFKIKRWIFDGPILIKETGKSEEHSEGFVVDKWCLLGSVKNEDDLENLNREYRFDMDAYKILAKFLLLPPKNISITNLRI